MKNGSYKEANITALGHDGFIVEYAEKVRFAFDPFDIQGNPVDNPTQQSGEGFLPKADYIFVSHPHYDHCDPSSIRKLSGETTKIIAPICCKNELADFGDAVEYVEDGEKHETKHFTYWTIPAYNINKYRTPTEVFHPKELGGVGFVVEFANPDGKNTRFYHAGDTDFTPEMAELKKVDVAFLPISGTFVMTLEEAVQAAEALEPKLAIPMHYGKLLGSSADANNFQKALSDKVPVMVLTTVDY